MNIVVTALWYGLILGWPYPLGAGLAVWGALAFDPPWWAVVIAAVAGVVAAEFGIARPYRAWMTRNVPIG